MSEAGTATRKPPVAQAAREGGQSRVSELKVSGHLMTLDTGVFCVFQAPGSPATNDGSGLPGVRISLPPGPESRTETVSISTFHDDGWLNGQDTAALIRVTKGPAQVLVTVYQAPTASADSAPRLQVMRLGGDQGSVAAPAAPAGMQAQTQPSVPVLSADEADVIAHVQRTGDLPAKLGEWVGTRGSRLWIEGFSLAPHSGIKPTDVEYQAVLGRGWLSPWIEGGKFCGSRGMALPLLGLKVRLKGNAAKTHECTYSATFVDGSTVGPLPAGETCEAESLAALEAFQVVIRRRGGAVGVTEAPPRMARAKAPAPVAPSQPPKPASAKRVAAAKKAR